MLEYLAESYNRYVIETNQNIYGTKKVRLPKAELYVLYTGSKQIKEREISFKKEFFNDNSPIEIRVKVISLKNSSKIVKEYIRFSKVLDNKNKQYNYAKKSINETIKYCITHNILKEYLKENRKEVYNMMTSVYDQDTAIEMCMREQYAEGRAEGKLSVLVSMVKDKLLSVAEAAKRLGVSEKEFMRLAKA